MTLRDRYILRPEVQSALDKIAEAEQTLRELGVLRSERDLDVDLAEWMATVILPGAQRAVSRTQAGWDIKLQDGVRVQVQKDRKSIDNIWRGRFWINQSKLDRLEARDAVLFILLCTDRSLESAYLIPVDDLRMGRVGRPYRKGYLCPEGTLAAYRVAVPTAA